MTTSHTTEGRLDERGVMREEWLNRLTELTTQVKTWVEELDWSTRQIKKKMEESRLGPYEAPALLMQKETTRVLLDPIARCVPGAEGAVDLYLMPAYDDIASLSYLGGQWQLQYVYPSAAAVAKSKPKPLTKETLARVLDEMIRHAS